MAGTDGHQHDGEEGRQVDHHESDRVAIEGHVHIIPAGIRGWHASQLGGSGEG